MAFQRTYVLIPGAGGDPWLWHRVVAELPGGHLVALSQPRLLADYLEASARASGSQ